MLMHGISKVDDREKKNYVVIILTPWHTFAGLYGILITGKTPTCNKIFCKN